MRRFHCLQGSGLPALHGLFAPLGVMRLVVPIPAGTPDAVEAHISAGGSPWHCDALAWRVHMA